MTNKWPPIGAIVELPTTRLGIPMNGAVKNPKDHWTFAPFAPLGHSGYIYLDDDHRLGLVIAYPNGLNGEGHLLRNHLIVLVGEQTIWVNAEHLRHRKDLQR